MTEKTALARFEQKQELAFRTLAQLTAQRKALEEQEKEIKEGIQNAMEHYGVKSFSNKYITLTYVEESQTEGIDLKALQNEEPELFAELLEDYRKVTKRSAYVRMNVKALTD